MGFIAYVGYPQTIYFAFRPNLRDEDDNHFVELAIASNADFLITSNMKDFLNENELEFQDLRVITPSNFMNYWRENYENKS
ncbi:putative toxin-antitoxin system, toxin component, PIN family [Leptospira santarosai str. CBC379]|nr:putative toxin-antitoxin system, toxin component, PIN family [Leptospira santarosai str. CBC379]